MKTENNPSFADVICDVRVRKIKSEFFNQMDLLIDWRPISSIINKHYKKGQSAVGCAAYDGLLLFKMALLQTWYGLSDYEVEDRINDSISFSKFCGLTLEQVSPDHSTLSRFRTHMTKQKVYEKLLKQMNKQLEKHKIIVKTGVIVDASVIESPFKPKGTVPHEVTQDRVEEPSVVVEKVYPPSVDQQAAWLKKGRKLHYGYKKHYVTDDEGLVLGVVTTAANVNEIANLDEVLGAVDLSKHTSVKADKGYQSQKNKELLKSKELKNHILKKAVKNKPLTEWEKKFNKLVGKVRFKVERTFGSIKRWFHSQGARYRGIEKMHTQNLMEAIAYNLYRSPGRIASISEKNS